MGEIIKISVDLKLIPSILYSGLHLYIVFHVVYIPYKVKTSEIGWLKNGNWFFWVIKGSPSNVSKYVTHIHKLLIFSKYL